MCRQAPSSALDPLLSWKECAMKMSLPGFVLAGAALIWSSTVAGADSLSFDVAKTDGCGCCIAWIDGLEAAGHTVAPEDMAPALLMSHKAEQGIPADLASCHTARVGGYVIEGHVPLADIERLLAEAPDAIGLAVPGMPLGSPGMEYGDEREAYDVLLVNRDGTTEVFNSYPASE
jgi:hypothetical protein